MKQLLRDDLRFSLGASRRGVVLFGAAVAAIDVLLLFCNLLFIALYELTVGNHPVLVNQRWNGDLDRSYIELFGYVKLLAATALLFYVWVTRRVAVYGVWMVVLFVLVADDAFLWHERVGNQLDGALGLPEISALRGQDLGELLFFAGVALVLGSLLVGAYLRAPSAAKRFSRVLFGLVLLLAFFAVVVDLFHVVAAQADSEKLVVDLLGFVETSGELLAMMLLYVTVLAVRRAPRADPAAA